MNTIIKLVISTVGLVIASAACAAEITLRAVSCWAAGSVYDSAYTRFIEKVNSEGKGLVQIKFLGGGPGVMPPFEVGNAVKGGVVDMANIPGAFYTNILPEADALAVGNRPIAELRKNGGLDYINKVWNEKMNVQYLARSIDTMPFHFFLKKPVSGPDLNGMRIRSTPNYRVFIQSLNGNVITMPPGDLYVALERGLVDGYTFPFVGLFDWALQEQTKYRVEPGFFNLEIAVLVNLNTWKKLDDQQRAFLVNQGLWMESFTNPQYIDDERKKQAAAGFQVIEFTGAAREQFLTKAYSSLWDSIVQRSPEHGPKLKSLIMK